MVESMKTYTVTYERDETGWWVASIKQVRGCHTQGRTIEQARKRIREALALYVDNAEEVKLVDDVRLPNKAQILLQQVEVTRKRAEEQTSKLQDSTAAAAKVLTHDLGVSMRDAGTILGLSHQRVHQLLLPSRKRSAHK